MAVARKATLTQSKLVTIIYGDTNSGKSTLASQLAYFKNADGSPFKILYLDIESGSIDDYMAELQANGVDLENLYMVYTQSLGEVKEYIRKVKENENFYVLDDKGDETEEVVLDADGKPFRADAIVVDGATILNITSKQGLVEFSKKRNKVKADKEGLIGDEKLVKVEGAGLELKDYQTINFKGQDFILDLMSSGVHCVVTARETDEKINKEIDGKSTSVATGKKIPEGFKGMDYNAKTVLRTFTEEGSETVYAYVVKDRTGIHKRGETIEDPSLLDWQAVIDKTGKNKKFVLKNDLVKAVETEEKIYSKEILNKVGAPSKVESQQVVGKNVNEVRTEINTFLKPLAPNVKAKYKKALTDKGLPTAFKSVAEVKVLEEVLNTLKTLKV